MTMGFRIRQQREAHNMTMEELAEKLNIQASAINKYEKGIVQNIKRDTIKQMASIFGCSPAWLMFGEDVQDLAIPNFDEKMQFILSHFPQLEETEKDIIINTISAFLNKQK